MQGKPQTDCQSQPTAETFKRNEEPTLIEHPTIKFFSHDERAEFYTGKERVTLQAQQIQRVRALQEANDHLQRQVEQNQKALAHSEDPLAILADIEHCSIMISRNAGEILNIYTQNELRLKRLALLEEKNTMLMQELKDTQAKFINSHEMKQRTKFAAEFFHAKAHYENNLKEIRELNQP